jgi:hypothetical protein
MQDALIGGGDRALVLAFLFMLGVPRLDVSFDPHARVAVVGEPAREAKDLLAARLQVIRQGVQPGMIPPFGLKEPARKGPKIGAKNVVSGNGVSALDSLSDLRDSVACQS